MRLCYLLLPFALSLVGAVVSGRVTTIVDVVIRWRLPLFPVIESVPLSSPYLTFVPSPLHTFSRIIASVSRILPLTDDLLGCLWSFYFLFKDVPQLLDASLPSPLFLSSLPLLSWVVCACISAVMCT